MRVLLAEDDKRLGKLIQYMLEQNGIQVEWVTNGSDIYEYAMYTDYDILILDWMMPGETGVEACSRLRKNGYEKAILMLTARDSVEDRVTGLDAGADDYLVKPFEFAELMARLRALGRRSTQKIQQDVVEVGEFTLNRTAKVLKKKDKVIQLSPREFQIFDLLAQNIGIVVPRDIILDRTGEKPKPIFYSKSEVDALLTQHTKDTLLAAYPVGSLYMSTEATSPASLFGGTWERVKDTFIMAAGDTYAAGSTASVSLSASQIPGFDMQIYMDGNFSYPMVCANGERYTGVSIPNVTGSNSGKGQQVIKANRVNNDIQAVPTLPPYAVFYAWKRIA